MKYELGKKYKIVCISTDKIGKYGVSAGDVVECHHVDMSGYLWTRDVCWRGKKVNPSSIQYGWCFVAPSDPEIILEEYEPIILGELGELEPSLSTIFTTSIELGRVDTSKKRTYDYVLSKCMEELGELSLEVQIENGLSYKEPGKDGIRGEAVDLAIAAMDMFALACGDMNKQAIENLFLSTMEKKIAKWKEKA